MRDHLIDLRLASADLRSQTPPANLPGSKTAPAPTSPPSRRVDFRAQHRAALQAALGDDFAERCARTMTVAQIDCVIDADDGESAAACTANR